MVPFRRTADSPVPDDAREASSELEDARIVVRLAGGDLGALAELYDRLGATVYALARHVAGDAAAEDVTQDVFLAARRGAARYDPTRGSVSTWLLTMARHRAVAARRRAPATHRPDAPDPVGATPEQQRLVQLVSVEGYTVTEAARIVGRPVDAVLADLAQAVERFRPEA